MLFCYATVTATVHSTIVAAIETELKQPVGSREYDEMQISAILQERTAWCRRPPEILIALIKEFDGNKKTLGVSQRQGSH